MGVYGVIVYSVGQRTLEFGIRMALGAKPQNVVSGIVGSGMRLALWGLLSE
jgi:putative ABC transport system permease protein